MTDAEPPVPAPRPGADAVAAGLLDAVDARMAAYAARAYAPATAAAYRRDWGQFTVWCHSTGQRPLPAPARTLARYVTVLADAGLRVATIERACAAVALAHRLADHESPTLHPDVALTLAGIRRELGTAAEQKRALLREDLVRLVAGCDEELRGRRDRALLLLGWAGGLRRGELAALDVDDLVDDPVGLVVRLARSKGDQEAKGRLVGVRYAPAEDLCAVRAVRAWLHAANLTDGPVFRGIDRHGRLADAALTGKSVAQIVKHRALAAGLDPATVAGHSLRRGHATQALRTGAPLHAVQAQLGHTSVDTTIAYNETARAVLDSSSSWLWEEA